MIKLIIVDDHPIVLKGLTALLNEDTNIVTLAAVDSAEELFVELKKHQNNVNVIVLDVSMPNMNGYDALLKLKATLPEIPVLMLSAMTETMYAEKSIAAGAKGFINKESAPEELINAIYTVANGEKYLGAQAKAKIYSKHSDTVKSLSKREFQVLILLGKGKTVGEIAESVNISVKTVSTYRSRLLYKLDLKNNSEIMQFYLTNLNDN